MTEPAYPITVTITRARYDALVAENEKLREMLERIDYVRGRISAIVPHTTITDDIYQIMEEVTALRAAGVKE